MIFLGFHGFLRVNELLNIRCRDISFENTYLKLHIPSSKTDVYRLGQYVHIARNDSNMCPVGLLKEYITAANIDETLHADSYIFRAITKSKFHELLKKKNMPLSYTRVRELFRSVFKDIGLDPSKYCTHSLRSGGATCAANNGISDRLFKRHGRWRSERAKDTYVQNDLAQLLSITKALQQ